LTFFIIKLKVKKINKGGHRMKKGKYWKDLTLVERVLFWGARSFSAEEIALKEGIEKEKVEKICKKHDLKLVTQKERVHYLCFIEKKPDAEIASELHLDIEKIKEVREEWGLPEQQTPLWSPDAFRAHSEPDPSH